jgi:hypothetical protein
MPAKRIWYRGKENLESSTKVRAAFDYRGAFPNQEGGET